MFIVQSYTLAIVFCVVTMLCWGSWGNTQKLASRTWRYEFFCSPLSLLLPWVVSVPKAAVLFPI